METEWPGKEFGQEMKGNSRVFTSSRSSITGRKRSSSSSGGRRSSGSCGSLFSNMLFSPGKSYWHKRQRRGSECRRVSIMCYTFGSGGGGNESTVKVLIAFSDLYSRLPTVLPYRRAST